MSPTTEHRLSRARTAAAPVLVAGHGVSRALVLLREHFRFEGDEWTYASLQPLVSS